MIAAAMENYFNCHRKDALNKFCPLSKSQPLFPAIHTVDQTSATSSSSSSAAAVSSLPQPPDVKIHNIPSAGSGEHKGKRTRRGCRSGKLQKDLKKRTFDQISASFPPTKDPMPPPSSTTSEQLHHSQPNPNPKRKPSNNKKAKFCPPQTQKKSKLTKVTTVGEKLFDKFLNGVVTDEKMKRSSDIHTQDLPSTSASSEFIEKKLGSSSAEDIFHPQVTN